MPRSFITPTSPPPARVREALVIPVAEGPRIVYPAAVVRAGKNHEGGRRLLAFLRSPEASAIFTRARISSRRSPRGTRRA